MSSDVIISRVQATQLLELLERTLAFAGDRADRELIELQHDLAELLRPLASTHQEHSTQSQ